MWILLLLFTILQNVHCSCPSGFEPINDEECRGNYTRVTAYADEAVSTAAAECYDILGTPAIIIHNEDDQKYWSGKVSSAPVWTLIGLVCNSTSKLWEWVDGSPLDFKPPKNLHEPHLDNDCTSTDSWWLRNDGFWGLGSAGVAFTTDIFCSTPLRQPIPSDEDCESFEDDSEDGVCYQVGSGAENWKDAQRTCSNLGANLASIHNDQENSFVRRLAVSKGAVNGLFLGATVSGKGNQFGWIDGSDWDYEHFLPGFPINGLGDCIIMNTEDTAGQWVNVDCSSKLSAACVRPQHYNTACVSGPWKEGQVIYSPGFPYDAAVPCEFILTVDSGKKVEVEILFLEANPCCDHLVIYENYFGSNIIANVTGEVNSQIFTTSSSNFMRVSWQPNGGENVRGMMMTFRGV